MPTAEAKGRAQARDPIDLYTMDGLDHPAAATQLRMEIPYDGTVIGIEAIGIDAGIGIDERSTGPNGAESDPWNERLSGTSNDHDLGTVIGAGENIGAEKKKPFRRTEQPSEYGRGFEGDGRHRAARASGMPRKLCLQGRQY
ncbi:UNVERIFIED_CONTAM: hypothetical protein K2H54_000820 [Gekko kuhli]